MSRHIFNFPYGGILTTMGSCWFVAYSYYKKINPYHLNWQNVSSYKTRINVFQRTQTLHKYFLRKILEMDTNNLDKNKIYLKGKQIKDMAKALLELADTRT